MTILSSFIVAFGREDFFFSLFKKNLDLFVTVEVGSLLHFILMTISALKISGPYPLHVGVRARHMFQRSCTVFDIMSQTRKYSIHQPAFNKQTGLRLYPHLCLYFLVNEHGAFSFLSPDSQGAEDDSSPWQEQQSCSLQVERRQWKGIIFLLFSDKYLKSNNVYHLVRAYYVPGTLLSISQLCVSSL